MTRGLSPPQCAYSSPDWLDSLVINARSYAMIGRPVEVHCTARYSRNQSAAGGVRDGEPSEPASRSTRVPAQQLTQHRFRSCSSCTPKSMHSDLLTVNC